VAGNKMIDWPAISAIAAACMVLGTGIGFLIRHSYVQGGRDSGTSARGKSAEVQAQTAVAEIKALAQQFHEHVVNDAAAFAELRAMVSANGQAQIAAENRIAKAIEEFGQALDRMGDRIDRLLDARQ